MGGQLEETEQAQFLQIPSSIAPLAEKGMLLSSGMGRGAPLTSGSYDLTQGKGRALPAPAISQISSA